MAKSWLKEARWSSALEGDLVRVGVGVEWVCAAARCCDCETGVACLRGSDFLKALRTVFRRLNLKAAVWPAWARFVLLLPRWVVVVVGEVRRVEGRV